MNPRIPIQLEEGALPPEYKTAYAAGADLRAYLRDDIVLRPGQRAAVPTGIRMAIPHGFEAQVRPRSGLALNDGITCLNSPGTIDSDYRGEVKVILHNSGEADFRVRNGDRIAQLVVAPVAKAVFAAEEIDATDRGEGGFGSTGK